MFFFQSTIIACTYSIILQLYALKYKIFKIMLKVHGKCHELKVFNK